MDLGQQSNVSAFNMLSRLVIAFLPKSKHLLISWLQSPSAVILEPQKIKSATVSTVSPSICHEVLGPDAMILVFLWFSHNSCGFSIIMYGYESWTIKKAELLNCDVGDQENKVCHCFHCFPIYLPCSDETRCHDLKVFEC